MNIEALVEHMQSVIDIAALGASLQREPVVQAREGTWRTMTEDEAAAVARLVGEAIGKRYAESLTAR